MKATTHTAIWVGCERSALLPISCRKISGISQISEVMVPKPPQRVQADDRILDGQKYGATVFDVVQESSGLQ